MQLTIEHAIAARQLAEEGMQRTLDAEREDWIANVIKAMQRFGGLPGWAEFKMEDFRVWYAGEGLPAPHDHHCWGAITNRACKAGVIKFTGKYAKSVSPKTHGHDVKVWRLA